MSQRDKRRLPVAALLIMSLYAPAPWASAGEDVRILLEILLEKGIITQEEFDQKLRKAKKRKIFGHSMNLRIFGAPIAKSTNARKRNANSRPSFMGSSPVVTTARAT